MRDICKGPPLPLRVQAAGIAAGRKAVLEIVVDVEDDDGRMKELVTLALAERVIRNRDVMKFFIVLQWLLRLLLSVFTLN